MRNTKKVYYHNPQLSLNVLLILIVAVPCKIIVIPFGSLLRSAQPLYAFKLHLL